MNGNQGPVGPEFTDEALNKKFSYAFTRKQLIILVNAIAPTQLSIGDMRTPVLLGILEEIQNTAINSITPDDYKKAPATPTEPLKEVQVN